MVAWKATTLSKQNLIKGKQRLIDLKYIIISRGNKIFYDQIKLTAARKGVAGFHVSARFNSSATANASAVVLLG